MLNHLIDVALDGHHSPLHAVDGLGRYSQRGSFLAFISPLYNDDLLQAMNWIEQRRMNPIHIWLTPSHLDTHPHNWIAVLRSLGYAGYAVNSLQELPAVLGG